MITAKDAQGRIAMSTIIEVAQVSQENIDVQMETALIPDGRKQPPTLTTGRVAELCGITKDQLVYRIAKGELPSGTVAPGNNRRTFTVAEAQECARILRKDYQRPNGCWATTIAVGNFKGGVTKTTTAVTLAQGLSLKGHRVLLIDLDPQGSATTLFGFQPAQYNKENDPSLLKLFKGVETSVEYAIKKTYWPGVDLITANPMLYQAEIVLPVRQMREGAGAMLFYEVLNVGLESVRAKYDVILIDTSPALSYTVMNAYMAADGMLVPMPPSALDFASSAQFWSLFADLLHDVSQKGLSKDFDFIHVLLAKVDAGDPKSSLVAGWIAKTYGQFLLPASIPKTNASTTSSMEFGTVYDVVKFDGGHATFKRALEAYNHVVDLIEGSIMGAWANQLADIDTTHDLVIPEGSEA